MIERPIRKYNNYTDPRLIGDLQKIIGSGYQRIEPGGELERLYLIYRMLRRESEVPQGESRSIKELGPTVNKRVDRLIQNICTYTGTNQERNKRILEHRRDSLGVAFVDTLPVSRLRPGIILPILPVPWRDRPIILGDFDSMNGLARVTSHEKADDDFSLMHEVAHGLMTSGSLKQHLTQGITFSGNGLSDKVATNGEKIPRKLGRKLHRLNEALADFGAFIACEQDIDILSYFQGSKGMDPSGFRAILGIAMDDGQPDLWPSILESAFFTGLDDKVQAEAFVAAFERALTYRK